MSKIKYTPEQVRRMQSSAVEMFEALTALTTNPHLNLGDLVYKIRESELKGWEGPAVIAWGKAVEATDAVLEKVKNWE